MNPSVLRSPRRGAPGRSHFRWERCAAESWRFFEGALAETQDSSTASVVRAALFHENGRACAGPDDPSKVSNFLQGARNLNQRFPDEKQSRRPAISITGVWLSTAAGMPAARASSTANRNLQTGSDR